MKNICFAIPIVVVLCFFPGCNDKGKTEKSSSSAEETFDKDSSYALGMNVGTNMRADNIFPNIEEFVQGMRDTLYESTPRFTFEEADYFLNNAYMAITEQRVAAIRQVENAFLAENSKKPGIIVTGSGLQYEVLKEGTGPKPSIADNVRVHYEGSLADGTVFDSSYSRGEPQEFPLGGIIPGWTEGLQLMNTGSIYRLFIPSDLGYGPQGRADRIPPYATLIFEVELLDIVQQNN